MRANSPIDDFKVLNTVEDESATEKLSQEHKELARAGKSKDGQIILDHLQKRCDDFTQILKTANITQGDSVTNLAKMMAAQLVIQEFESVLRDVEISKQAVKDATNG